MTRTETISSRAFFRVTAFAFVKQNIITLILILVFGSGLWIRFYWLGANPTIIENEGGEYARLAENIFNRVGYIGTQTGRQLLFPPLYPLLISLGMGVVGDSELAGRLISLLMGSLLFIPVYLLIATIYNRKTALVGALLVTFHPYLIEVSVSVLSEATYLFFMLWGLYGGLSALYKPSKRTMVYSGLAWGLAYLTRTEGLLGLVITLSMVVVVHVFAQRTELAQRSRLEQWPRLEQKRGRNLVANLICLAGTFLLLVAPYLLFLYSVSGHLRFENKSLIVYTISERMLSGMSYEQAALEIDQNLAQLGPELNNTAFVLTTTNRPSIDKLLSFISHFYYQNLKHIFQMLITFATPPVMLLVPLGLFRHAWSRKRVVGELYLWAFYGATLFLLFSIAFIHDRYVTSFLPILLIWAAVGTVEMADWLSATVRNLSSTLADRIHMQSTSMGMVVLLVLLLFFFKAENVLAQQQLATAELSQRTAGLWLRNQLPGPKVVMSTDTATAYYSGSTWVPFPYTTDSVRLAYIEKINPDFLVLYEAIVDHSRPDLRQWYHYGITDARAKLVYKVGDTAIYRWETESQDSP